MVLTHKEEGDDCYLPPPVVIGPDEDGVRKVIEYRIEEGMVLKVTTTTRSRSKLAAKEHRSWARFGDATDDDATFRSRNPPHPNVFSSQEVFLDRPGIGSRAARGDGSVVCRTCKKGYHWTSRCPYSDLYSQLEALDEQPKPACEGGRSAAYVPPKLKPGGGDNMRRRNHDNTVRVDNLSEKVRDPDLLELFAAVGPVRRAHQGFGFVEFVRRADAERAIHTLDRYGYDHLIIRVERPERRVA
ncbi:hypothetical protein CFC21_012321 [Triticum aestivum]|uniref:RRM domain-containing protein n=2 Tax=Triticum aestivum TaxID=4565 RepID=A0A9R1IWT5_WHEAT|nr:hypothetical protein CFC21_012321 [Triticum aestivum]